jgi:regulator of RNase E activity RraA
MSIGFRVLERTRQVDADTVARFATIPVANVSDSMSRLTGSGARLRPMHESGRMAGVALTVKTRPGDNLMIHVAINVAKAGDVIVVDAGGDLTNSLMGEMMLEAARQKGIAGFVLDGAIRDLASFRVSSVPVFAAGVTHRGPYKSGPGEVNVPIAIDGMVVEPGDLIVGDDDGVLRIGYDEAAGVLVVAEKLSAHEVEFAKVLARGEADRTKWDTLARQLGCEFPGGAEQAAASLDE